MHICQEGNKLGALMVKRGGWEISRIGTSIGQRVSSGHNGNVLKLGSDDHCKIL